MEIPNNLLTLILFTPTVLGLLILLLPSDEVKLTRWVAFLGSLIPFALSLVLWFNFNPNQPGFQFEEQYVWYGAINSSYHLGVDGISLTMVLLTTLLTPLAGLARRVTISGESPLVASDANTDLTLASLIEIASGTFWITGFDSSSQARIRPTNTGDNNGTGNYAIYYLLFNAVSPRNK